MFMRVANIFSIFLIVASESQAGVETEGVERRVTNIQVNICTQNKTYDISLSPYALFIIFQNLDVSGFNYVARDCYPKIKYLEFSNNRCDRNAKELKLPDECSSKNKITVITNMEDKWKCYDIIERVEFIVELKETKVVLDAFALSGLDKVESVSKK